MTIGLGVAGINIAGEKSILNCVTDTCHQLVSCADILFTYSTSIGICTVLTFQRSRHVVRFFVDYTSVRRLVMH
jgi:hypothetical protein